MGTIVTKNNPFGLIDKMFINLYSKDNPILNVDDICYFLFTNMIDIHRPLIASGKIVKDFFTDGMNKVYIIELHEIFENDYVIDKFLYNGNTVSLHQFNDNVLTKSSKVHFLNENTDKLFFQKNVFKIESFFVRNDFDKIVELRNDYIKIIRKDLLQQISEIDDILEIYYPDKNDSK